MTWTGAAGPDVAVEAEQDGARRGRASTGAAAKTAYGKSSREMARDGAAVMGWMARCGNVWLGKTAAAGLGQTWCERRGWAVAVGRGPVESDAKGHGGSGRASSGTIRWCKTRRSGHDGARAEWLGQICPGKARRAGRGRMVLVRAGAAVKARLVVGWHGGTSKGWVRSGAAWRSRNGEAGRGAVGKAGSGVVWRSWIGKAAIGPVWSGWAVEVRDWLVWQGGAGIGRAGGAGNGTDWKTRHGAAG